MYGSAIFSIEIPNTNTNINSVHIQFDFIENGNPVPTFNGCKCCYRINVLPKINPVIPGS